MTTLVADDRRRGGRRLAGRRASCRAGRAGGSRSGWACCCSSRPASCVARVTGFVPGGGDALGLRGPRLAIGIAGNFMLGALMTLGIGLYAPCMILVALLGMNDDGGVSDHDGVVRVPDAGGVGPLRALGALRSARGAGPDASRARRRSLIAAFIVKSLPLAAVKWLVVVRRGLHCGRDVRSAARDEDGRREMANPLFATKSVDALRAEAEGEHGLKRTLGPVRSGRARHRRHHRRRPVRAHGGRRRQQRRAVGDARLRRRGASAAPSPASATPSSRR